MYGGEMSKYQQRNNSSVRQHWSSEPKKDGTANTGGQYQALQPPPPIGQTLDGKNTIALTIKKSQPRSASHCVGRQDTSGGKPYHQQQLCLQQVAVQQTALISDLNALGTTWNCAHETLRNCLSITNWNSAESRNYLTRLEGQIIGVFLALKDVKKRGLSERYGEFVTQAISEVENLRRIHQSRIHDKLNTYCNCMCDALLGQLKLTDFPPRNNISAVNYSRGQQHSRQQRGGVSQNPSPAQHQTTGKTSYPQPPLPPTAPPVRNPLTTAKWDTGYQNLATLENAHQQQMQTQEYSNGSKVNSKCEIGRDCDSNVNNSLRATSTLEQNPMYYSSGIQQESPTGQGGAVSYPQGSIDSRGYHPVTVITTKNEGQIQQHAQERYSVPDELDIEVDLPALPTSTSLQHNIQHLCNTQAQYYAREERLMQNPQHAIQVLEDQLRYPQFGFALEYLRELGLRDEFVSRCTDPSTPKEHLGELANWAMMGYQCRWNKDIFNGLLFDLK